MNVIKTLQLRIAARLLETKNPCKSYATEEAADAAMHKKAALAAKLLAESDMPARYVVFYVEAMGRWVGAVDFTELLARKTAVGGYLGILPGVYTY